MFYDLFTNTNETISKLGIDKLYKRTIDAIEQMIRDK